LLVLLQLFLLLPGVSTIGFPLRVNLLANTARSFRLAKNTLHINDGDDRWWNSPAFLGSGWLNRCHEPKDQGGI